MWFRIFPLHARPAGIYYPLKVPHEAEMMVILGQVKVSPSAAPTFDALDVHKCPLPSYLWRRYPSDHVAIAARFIWS